MDIQSFQCFIGKTNLSPLKCLYSFVKGPLTLCVWVHIWAPYPSVTCTSLCKCHTMRWKSRFSFTMRYPLMAATHICLEGPWMVVGYTLWDELIGFVSTVITPIQALTFQTRKQGVGGHLLTHQFTFLWEALTFTLGYFPSSLLVPVPQWRLTQLQVPLGTLAFNEVSCSRQPVFMRPLYTLYPEGRLKSLGNLACDYHIATF